MVSLPYWFIIGTVGFIISASLRIITNDRYDRKTLLETLLYAVLAGIGVAVAYSVVTQ